MIDRVVTVNYSKNKQVRNLPISSSLYEVLEQYFVTTKGILNYVDLFCQLY